ncbi:hypothetical protein [Tenacibaculum dicentrarchi]|uniref:hypothetical protein n=1 Tax=Tenacibaculum dicentrarchi TaxID=669041 RepID=UPI000C4F9F4A|nr:hypothetical protein TNO021_200021 [Tenacibaculum dicentrarchi]
MNIIKEASENLQLYFHLGDINNFNSFDELSKNHFIEKDDFPEDVNSEIKLMQKENIRIDFIRIAHRLYKKQGIPASFKQGAEMCENIILKFYTQK